MNGLWQGMRWRGVIGLIAAYAIALQAVFTMLAPMPALASADGDPFAAHCFGNAGLTESGQPGTPPPASGKMHCVFCGACAAGFLVLPPTVADIIHRPPVAPLAFASPASLDLPGTANARDGPARAPPLAV